MQKKTVDRCLFHHKYGTLSYRIHFSRSPDWWNIYASLDTAPRSLHRGLWQSTGEHVEHGLPKLLSHSKVLSFEVVYGKIFGLAEVSCPNFDTQVVVTFTGEMDRKRSITSSMINWEWFYMYMCVCCGQFQIVHFFVDIVSSFWDNKIWLGIVT